MKPYQTISMSGTRRPEDTFDIPEKVRLTFDKKPSRLMTFRQAILSQKQSLRSGQSLPEIELNRFDLGIDKKHLARFNRLCSENDLSFISILYPSTMVYPYVIRMLSHKSIPLSIFRSLNIRTILTRYQPIRPETDYDLLCRISGWRVVENGIEIDIAAGLYHEAFLAWQTLQTFYYRGNFGEPDDAFSTPRPEPVADGITTAPFQVTSKNAFRFSRVSGDMNGIHYSSFYARMISFKAAFAQPLRTVSICLQKLSPALPVVPAQFSFFYKEPVYYNTPLTLSYTPTQNDIRFDLFSEGDQRPCISGQFQPLTTG